MATKIVQSPNFKPVATTTSEYCDPKYKEKFGTEFHVDTRKTTYRANSLNEALLLWKNSGDTDEVINIGSLG